MNWIILVLCFIVCEADCRSNVADCETNEQSGECIIVRKCPYAINLLKRGKVPQLCGFDGHDPIVCCLSESADVRQPGKPGELSLKKCEEYYPPQPEQFFVTVFNGNKSLAKEFPHMAAIGYGDKNNILWGCGGTLISETFILTAAHCLGSKSFGPATYVRLGDLDLASDSDNAEPQEFEVKRAIRYPDYVTPPKYHDIALLELTSPVKRTEYVNIACLDTEVTHEESIMTATGWGKTEFAGDSSSFLLKADLEVVPSNKCQRNYRRGVLDILPRGIIDNIMICAGGESDTCQGDSGGPLVIKHPKKFGNDKIYNVVGVTSFGKACGTGKIPGVYTRVSSYLEWIESIVWPDG